MQACITLRNEQNVRMRFNFRSLHKLFYSIFALAAVHTQAYTSLYSKYYQFIDSLSVSSSIKRSSISAAGYKADLAKSFKSFIRFNSFNHFIVIYYYKHLWELRQAPEA